MGAFSTILMKEADKCQQAHFCRSPIQEEGSEQHFPSQLASPRNHFPHNKVSMREILITYFPFETLLFLSALTVKKQTIKKGNDSKLTDKVHSSNYLISYLADCHTTLLYPGLKVKVFGAMTVFTGSCVCMGPWQYPNSDRNAISGWCFLSCLQRADSESSWLIGEGFWAIIRSQLRCLCFYGSAMDLSWTGYNIAVKARAGDQALLVLHAQTPSWTFPTTQVGFSSKFQ